MAANLLGPPCAIGAIFVASRCMPGRKQEISIAFGTPVVSQWSERRKKPKHMKLVTWNCHANLDRTVHLAAGLKADLLVVQNCPLPTKSAMNALRAQHYVFLWSGTSRGNGVAVVASRGISIEPARLHLDADENLLPVMVDGCWPMLAVNAGRGSRVPLLWRFLQEHPTFLHDPRAILVGDLNSNRRTDLWRSWVNHQTLVDRLHNLGLRSGYHETFKERQGEEAAATSFVDRNTSVGRHTQYAFVGTGWDIMDVHIGDSDRWLMFGEHLPMVVTLDSSLISQKQTFSEEDVALHVATQGA